MLALESRENIDDRTFGELFYHCCDEIHDIAFSDSFYLLLSLFKNAVRDYLTINTTAIDELILDLISSLPASIKGRLRFLSCES
jgi:hypothetical protein